VHVLHCIASIDASYGGPVSVLKGLYQGLSKLDVDITVLSCSSGNIERDAKNAQLFPGANFIWSRPVIQRFYWEPRLLSRIGNNLKEFDVLHVHGIFNGLTSGVCRAARKRGITYVIEPFGTLSPYCLSKSYIRKRAALALNERKNIERAAAVLFTSQAEQQRAEDNFKIHNCFVVANGLDWSEFETLPQRGGFRDSFGIEQEDKVLLFLGRLQAIKGLELFLPAFARWVKSLAGKDHWRCVLVGPDEAGYRRTLEKLIAELGAGKFIHLVGPLYGGDRVQALVDSDIVFLPSFHENFGISAIEGMACRKPVFVSDQVDLWQVVKDYDLGVVAPLTEEGIISGLDKINFRHDEWLLIGERARTWAMENCNWNVISKSVLDIYRQVLSAT